MRNNHVHLVAGPPLDVFLNPGKRAGHNGLPRFNPNLL